MKITGEGFEKGAMGLVIITGFGLMLWVGKKLYDGLSGVAGDVSQGFAATSDALAGSAFEAINGDPNAQVQSKVQQAMAALKAAGSPAPGTPKYQQIYAEYFP